MTLGISAVTGVDVTPDDTLIILDEIQESPHALESLKRFGEEAPEYPLLASVARLNEQKGIELIKEGTLLRQLRLTNDTYAEVVRNEIEEARNYYNHGGETDPNKEDFRFRKDMIGKRIQELTTSQKVAESFSPQIRISEDNCFKMADRIWDTLVSVMPLLRSKIAMENSKTILSQTRKMIRDALNDMEKPF